MSARPPAKGGSGKKAADRVPVWQRAPPPPRVAIPQAAQGPPLAPGERPPFNTSFSVAEGPLSQRGRAPSAIREKGAGNPISAASVAAVGVVHTRRASGVHSPAPAAATTTTSSPAKRPGLARAASVSSPAGVNVFTSTTSPLSSSQSVKRTASTSSPSQPAATTATSPGTRIPLPKGSLPAPTGYRPSLSAPRKGSGNKASGDILQTPPRVREDDISDESGTDVASPELRRPEFGREEVKRMLAERRAEREAREREEADFSALLASEEPSEVLSAKRAATTTASSTAKRSHDERSWLAEQNRKLEEAQEEREAREEDAERLKMERDARTREADEQRHQLQEFDDNIQLIMTERVQSGNSRIIRQKLEETWKAQLDTEFAARRRQAEEMAEAKVDEERKRKELEDTKQRLMEDQIAHSEEVKRAAMEAEIQRREAEEYAILARGMELTKVANKKLIGGSPKKCVVSLIRLAEPGSAGTPTGPWAVRWESRKKKSLGEAMMLLEDCDLALGIQHGNFRKEKTAKQFAEFESLAFSLLSPKRSLDLVCAKKDDFELWIRVLKRLPVCSVLHDRSELASSPIPTTPDIKQQDIPPTTPAAAAAAASFTLPPAWPTTAPPSFPPPQIPNTPSSKIGAPIAIQIDNEHSPTTASTTSVAF